MEKDIGSLKKVSGHTFDTIYNLLFTTERAIALIIEHPLDIPRKPGAAGLLLGEGYTRRGERSEKRKIMEDRLILYEEQTFDELVSNNDFNFEIPYNKVDRVELTRGLFAARLKFHIPEKLRGESKFIFTLTKKQVPEARRLLDQVLPSKVYTPKR
jgi:hypothetical protein